MEYIIQSGLGGFISWFGLATAIISAFWAVVSFRRNNKIKAAEILIEIEQEYGKHIPTLLQIEYEADYKRIYKEALRKSIEDNPPNYKRCESIAIDRLEAVLRHFYVCAAIRRLSVDSGTIDRMHAWYLHILVEDMKHERPELQMYIKHFWPSIYLWAPLAAAPWPKKLVILFRQLPDRINYWWSGSWAKYPRLGKAP